MSTARADGLAAGAGAGPSWSTLDNTLEAELERDDGPTAVRSVIAWPALGSEIALWLSYRQGRVADSHPGRLLLDLAANFRLGPLAGRMTDDDWIDAPGQRLRSRTASALEADSLALDARLGVQLGRGLVALAGYRHELHQLEARGARGQVEQGAMAQPIAVGRDQRVLEQSTRLALPYLGVSLERALGSNARLSVELDGYAGWLRHRDRHLARTPQKFGAADLVGIGAGISVEPRLSLSHSREADVWLSLALGALHLRSVGDGVLRQRFAGDIRPLPDSDFEVALWRATLSLRLTVEHAW